MLKPCFARLTKLFSGRRSLQAMECENYWSPEYGFVHFWHMYLLHNTKPQGLSNCRANVSQEQHNLFVKLPQIRTSAFCLYHLFWHLQNADTIFWFPLSACLIPTWDDAHLVTGSRSLALSVVARAAMTPALWFRPPSAACSALSGWYPAVRKWQCWRRLKAASETSLTSAYEITYRNKRSLLTGMCHAKG